MSDLIDRQVAIDALGALSDAMFKNIEKGATYPKRQWFDGMANAESIIKELPSAQPERPKGKWIVSHIPDSMLWECNQCGFDCGAHSFNFCPNCGADMRER